VEPPAVSSVARLEVVDETLVAGLVIDFKIFDAMETHVSDAEDDPERVEKWVLLCNRILSLRFEISSWKLALRGWWRSLRWC
jgi:hypothetical protein